MPRPFGSFFLEGKNGFNGEKKVTCCRCCASVFLNEKRGSFRQIQFRVL